jgi:hypothetical protein
MFISNDQRRYFIFIEGFHQAAACCGLSAIGQLDKAKLQFIFFQVEQLPVHGAGNRDRARTQQP